MSYRITPRCTDCGTQQNISRFLSMFWICDDCLKKRAEDLKFKWKHKNEEGCRNCHYYRRRGKLVNRCSWNFHIVTKEELKDGCSKRYPYYVKRLVNGKPRIIAVEYADSYPKIKSDSK